ncbi:MAG: branched-chain amino acid ABC transporter permease [Syntrophaceae bacterium]|nr:branched-chain amino acid ABC transporter permease [Syntrophaceae bacterium]
MSGMIVYGLVNSAVFVLMALGFSLTFGISGVANFAHGAFYVTGAYVTWQLVNSLGFSYPLAMALSILVTGVFGAIMYWIVLYRIRGLEISEVIATFGLGIGLLETYRSLGLSGHSYKLPKFVDGSIEILGVYIDFQRLIVIGVATALVLFLWLFSHRTKMGLAFRGIAQDEYTALAFGIEPDITAMVSLGIGAALAAVAAVVIVPLSLIQVDEGKHILILALAVGIVGGMESIVGIVAASLVFGFAQIIVATYFNLHYTMIVMFAAILLVLIIKPSGLFGKFKELEERV